MRKFYEMLFSGLLSIRWIFGVFDIFVRDLQYSATFIKNVKIRAKAWNGDSPPPSPSAGLKHADISFKGSAK